MPKILYGISINQCLLGNGIDEKVSLVLQNRYKLNNHQFMLLIWLKGLWTGILISLIIHQLLSH